MTMDTRSELSSERLQEPDAAVAAAKAQDLTQKTRQMALYLHLSVLAGFIIPVAGLVIPIVLWQMKKNELPQIDAHGKNVVNWIISEVIYWIICYVLIFLLIGIPIAMGLTVIGIVFPVVAAIKGYRGEVWKYPMAIPFFS